MIGAHHVAEAFAAAWAEIARRRSEEAERVVAPVIGEALIHQVEVVEEFVDGQKLDRGHAERLDVIHGGLVAKPSNVPRSSSGIFGLSLVKPFTCVS